MFSFISLCLSFLSVLSIFPAFFSTLPSLPFPHTTSSFHSLLTPPTLLSILLQPFSSYSSHHFLPTPLSFPPLLSLFHLFPISLSMPPLFPTPLFTLLVPSLSYPPLSVPSLPLSLLSTCSLPLSLFSTSFLPLSLFSTSSLYLSPPLLSPLYLSLLIK